jgi:hypothetical protein
MPSAEHFKRIALISIISLVIGIGTLANMLKQPAPPEDTIARAAFASPSERLAPPPAVPQPAADEVPPLVKDAKPEMPAPATTAAAPAPPPPPAPIVEPPTPTVSTPAAQAAEFPPMQPMEEIPQKPAASAAARAQKPDTGPARAAEKPAAEKPVSEKPAAEKPDVKRAAEDRSKRKHVRPAPYPMRDFLASHR